MLTARGVVVDWECFRRVFLEKYFPESVRHAKEAEFMRLHLGGMTLKRVVMPMAITEFPTLVKKGKVVERLEGRNRVTKTAEGPSGGGRQGGGATLRCYRCARPHLVRDCPHTKTWCFKCHQMGHESTHCPTRNGPERGDAQKSGAQRSGAQRGDAQRGDRSTTTGRVFALAGAEASTYSDLLKGKGRAAGKDVMILFDSGASHSFISYACAAILGVPVRIVVLEASEVSFSVLILHSFFFSFSSPLSLSPSRKLGSSYLGFGQDFRTW
ncbi:uncharacterized protein LOC109789235 [Cajanus cajan]|uniref:uncharacterized protein LOC109789235 n=1 Tax=Cajanus cajan TaxID=3821 RepID=UPI00098DD308|nr:uncharacterized protein LOC109789235 [Cajanus cajan]